MSQTTYSEEPDEQLWDYYLKECRTTNTQPNLSDFKVWVTEQDYDLNETEYPDVQ